MRISFDLDEVLFVSPDLYEVEPALHFPFNRLYKERLRKGTPELINELQKRGYEVWVYTSSFRSDAYIKRLFRHYGVHFDDIVNGYRHISEVQQHKATTLPQKMPSHYRISLHIDDEKAVMLNSRNFGYRVFKVDEPDPDWVQKVLDEAERVRKLEETDISCK